MTQSQAPASAKEAAEMAVGQGITVDGKNYKREDLSDEVVLIVATFMEANNLQQVKEMEMKHIGISMQALESSLKTKLEGVPFTEVSDSESND